MADVLLCQGTALHLPLKDASVHTVCTSPPFYGLRDYQTGAWEGGDPSCAHSPTDTPQRRGIDQSTLGGGTATTGHQREGYRGACPRCGAVRVDAQLGLEASPDLYIAAMVQVFREVKRVLHPMGTLWVNIGDSMCEKQLQGLPWRFALALQADGWVLRAEVIWHKLNPMPESVQDRPTRSHEQVFLFAKQSRYFYDAEAVKEATDLADLLRHNPHGRQQNATAKNTMPGQGIKSNASFHAAITEVLPFRNMRTVWSLPSAPIGFQHYAAFPTALVRRCLLAGAPSRVCSACSAPHRRVVERQRLLDGHIPVTGAFCRPEEPYRVPNGIGHYRYTTQTTDHGFTATCACNAGVGKAVILDPFVGSGTVLLVARELGHHAVGIDLSRTYLHDIARERLGLSALHAWTHGQMPQAVSYADLPLFGGDA